MRCAPPETPRRRHSRGPTSAASPACYRTAAAQAPPARRRPPRLRRARPPPAVAAPRRPCAAARAAPPGCPTLLDPPHRSDPSPPPRRPFTPRTHTPHTPRAHARRGAPGARCVARGGEGSALISARRRLFFRSFVSRIFSVFEFGDGASAARMRNETESRVRRHWVGILDGQAIASAALAAGQPLRRPAMAALPETGLRA